MTNSIFVSDVSREANFARKKGSKDKKKRTIRNLAVGAGTVAVVTGLGLLALKNKKKIQLPVNKKQQNTAKVQQRLAAIRAEGKKAYKNTDDVFNQGKNFDELLGVKPSRMDIRLRRQFFKEDVKQAVKKLRKDNAYYSMGDLAEFGRRKGSKDKKKRSVGINGSEIRRSISTGNRVSQELRGWLTQAKRFGIL